MNNVTEFLPFLVPLVISELALLAYTLYHILTHKSYKRGNRTLWLIVVLPAPFSPTKPKTLCSGTDKFNPVKTSLSPKCFFKFVIRSISTLRILLPKQEIKDRSNKLHTNNHNNENNLRASKVGQG